MKVRRLFACFLLTCLITPYLFVRYAIPSVAAQSFAASLSPQAGLVQVKTAGSETWTTIWDLQLINAGDQIRTGSNGRAQLSTPTGLRMTIFPTTLLQLESTYLSDDDGAITVLLQFVGTTYTQTQELTKEDRLLIALPTAGAIIHGAQLLTMVLPDNPHPAISAAVLVIDGDVRIIGADHSDYTLGTNTLYYSQLATATAKSDLSTFAASVQSTSFQASFSGAEGFADNLTTFQDFLQEMLQANSTGQARTYLRTLLQIGEPSAPEQIQDIIDALGTLQNQELDLNATLQTLAQFWTANYRGQLNAILPRESCGNGVPDENETAEDCPDDWATLESCGNAICETQSGAESLLNCPLDCSIDEDIASFTTQANATAIEGRLIVDLPPTPIPSGAGN